MQFKFFSYIYDMFRPYRLSMFIWSNNDQGLADWYGLRFNNNINYVVGQAWWAGNLSYNLDSRPKYIRGYLNFVNKKFKPNDGVVYIEDKDSKLTKSCPGVSFTIHTRYICMVGTK